MLKILAGFTLLLVLSGCSTSAPNSAGACEQYFDASDRTDRVVDDAFDSLDTLTTEQRAALAATYTAAIYTQAGKALLLSLSLTSEGLETSAFGGDVQDLLALLSQQVAFLDAGQPNDGTTLLQIVRLETQIQAECIEIGANF